MFEDVPILRPLRLIFRPAGLIGIGVMALFVGLTWIFEDQRDLRSPPSEPADFASLQVRQGVIADMNTRLPTGSLPHNTIAVRISAAGSDDHWQVVPNSVARVFDYLKLKGLPITARQDQDGRLAQLIVGQHEIVRYEDYVAERKRMRRDFDLAYWRYLGAGAILFVCGTALAWLGVFWWRRRGYP